MTSHSTVEVEISLPVLHPVQEEIESTRPRYGVLSCGRRMGKTALVVDIEVNHLIDGHRVAYFVPSYSQGEEVWQEFKRTLEPIIARKDESSRRLETTTGGVFEMWSLASEKVATRVKGRKYHGVVIDEAALVPNLMNIWNETISPTLTDYQGFAVFVSTPRGYNDFHTLYALGLDPLEPEWRSWHYPTSANPYILVDEIEAQRHRLPDRLFRQEYLAEFIDDAGVVFRNIDAVCVLPARDPYKGRFVFGVDWARDNDFTVISVMDVVTCEQVHMERFNQIGWAVQRGRIQSLYDLWQPERIIAETNSIGSVNIEALQAEGLPVQAFTTTAHSKGPLIDNLTLLMEQGRVKLLDDPVQRNELQSYTMERLSSGTYRYSAPSGGHDDTVIALALSCYGLNQSVPTNW